MLLACSHLIDSMMASSYITPHIWFPPSRFDLQILPKQKEKDETHSYIAESALTRSRPTTRQTHLHPRCDSVNFFFSSADEDSGE